MTTKKGVFAGGDIVIGAATVILAMEAGKKAAKYMDEYITNMYTFLPIIYSLCSG